MKRIATVAIALNFAFALLGAFTPPVKAELQQGQGKYQLVQGHDGEMFMLNTETGDVYVRYPGGRWTLEANPPAEARQKARERAEKERAEREAEAARKQAKEAAGNDETKPLKLELPQEVTHLTVNQRSSKILPGSDKQIYLHIGDVTRGRVVVSIFTTRGQMLLDYVSIRPGEVASFRVNGESAHIKLLELKNAIIGQDFAEFELSKDRRALTESDDDANEATKR